MAKRKVFYSFHYGNDVFRVQQIRNMGVLLPATKYVSFSANKDVSKSANKDA